MPERSYGQYCALAKALDVVGERWTLLLVRELLLGPRRFTDLQANLPGIGTSLLASRLKHLEQHGIAVRKRLPPPAGSVVYELTTSGLDLGRALLPLVMWGSRLLGERRADETFRLEWPLLALRTLLAGVQPGSVRGTVEFRVDGDVFHIRCRRGEVALETGPASNADATVSTDIDSFLEVGLRRLALSDAMSSGRVSIEGDLGALERVMSVVLPG